MDPRANNSGVFMLHGVHKGPKTGPATISGYFSISPEWKSDSFSIFKRLIRGNMEAEDDARPS